MQKVYKPGDKVNGYTVIDYNDETKEYEFVCNECGTKKTGYYYHLMRVCGHYIQMRELDSVFRGMLSRCYSPKRRGYSDYGGRGITVCDQWLKCPKSFEDWSLDNGWAPGLQLDRIDNNSMLGYSPSNCRWVTGTENQNNKRNNIRLTVNGATLTIAEWSRQLGLRDHKVIQSYYHLHGEKRTCERIKEGWIKYPNLHKVEIQGIALTLPQWSVKLGRTKSYFTTVKNKHGLDVVTQQIAEEYQAMLDGRPIKRRPASTEIAITIQGITDNGHGWSRRLNHNTSYVSTLIKKHGKEKAIQKLTEEYQDILTNNKKPYSGHFCKEITIQGITDSYQGWSKRLERPKNYVSWLISKYGKDKAIRCMTEQWNSILGGAKKIKRKNAPVEITVDNVTKNLTEWAKILPCKLSYLYRLNYLYGIETVSCYITEQWEAIKKNEQ